jgi:hypothetical protein
MNPSGLTWRKLRRSTNGGKSCVEVAETGGWRLVRDSEDPNSWILTFSGARWFGCTKGVRAGQFG